MEEQRAIAVIYKTKYGSAEKYARWIAGEAGADLFESGSVGLDQLQKYDTLVFGGSLYAVGILGIKTLTDHFEELKGKKLVAFSVGASPAWEDARKNVLEKNFTAPMRDKIDFFMLRGAFDFNRLNLGDKALMTMMKARILSKKPQDRTEDETDLLASFDKSVDWTTKDAIEPILACIR